ncbi:MAG: hypothetical protein J2P48_11255, partial [Alphaproteobacteria bacterium]|nr:hypothetical protein [Alphaproteobacteria bacterium]
MGGRKRALCHHAWKTGIYLHTEFRTGAGVMCAVDGISYPVEANGSLVIVGKSGSGTPAGPLSILRLIPNPPDPMAGGDTRFGV